MIATHRQANADYEWTPAARVTPRVAVPADLTSLARPRNRSQCVGGARPCPWASCRYHLGVDWVGTGAIATFGESALVDLTLEQSCALDVADRGPHRVEDVGDVMNVSRALVSKLCISAADVLRLQLDEPHREAA